MAAAQYNITIEQGVTFEIEFTLKTASNTALNITGYDFQGEIRNSTDNYETVVGTFAFTITNASEGIVKMIMTPAVTAAIPALPTLKWDLLAKDSSDKVYRYLTGNVAVVDTITDTTFA